MKKKEQTEPPKNVLNRSLNRVVTAGDFKKYTGKYQDMALSAPITITKHDRPSLVLLSFEEYQKITGNTQRALHVSQLSDEDIEAIVTSKVPSSYDHLNDEME